MENFGTHIVFNLLSLEYINNNESKVFQFFTKSPQSRTKITIKPDLNLIIDFIKQHKLKPFIHAQYILNFSNMFNVNMANNSFHSIFEDLEFCDKIYGVGVVLHMGKNVKKFNISDEIAYDNFRQSIIYIINECIIKKNLKCKLLLETSVKNKIGSDLFWDYNNIYNFLWKDLPANIKKHIGFVIDTCHIFASGYEINKVKGIIAYLKDFVKLFGVKNITLFHLNDSKTPFNSQLDRHFEIGKGFIFKDDNESLLYILNFAKKHKIPLISETGANLTTEQKYIKNL